MFKRGFVAVPFLWSVIALASGSLFAEETERASYDSLVDRIAALESQIAEDVDGELYVDDMGHDPHYAHGEYGGCGDYGSCHEGCYKCRSPWYAGFELVYAKPHFEDEVDSNDIDDPESGYDFEASPRFWLGYEHCGGCGVRARYWIWDHSSEDGEAFGDPFGLSIEALDLEITRALQLGCAEARFHGGVRYGKVEHLENDGEGVSFEGAGPTLGCEWLFPVRCSKWSLVGNLRGSMLFGETSYTGFNQSGDHGDDDFIYSLETQLGVQHVHCFCHGGTLACRALVEGQVWPVATKDPEDSLDAATSTDEDLGFIGFVLSAEYRH